MEPTREEEWPQLNATTSSGGNSSRSETRNINLNETPNEDQSMRESGGNENNPSGGGDKAKRLRALQVAARYKAKWLSHSKHAILDITNTIPQCRQTTPHSNPFQ